MANIQAIRKNRRGEIVANPNREQPERRSNKTKEDRSSQFQGRRSQRNQNKQIGADPNRLQVANKGIRSEVTPAMRPTRAEIREITQRTQQTRATDEAKTTPRNLPLCRATHAHLDANPAINGIPSEVASLLVGHLCLAAPSRPSARRTSRARRARLLLKPRRQHTGHQSAPTTLRQSTQHQPRSPER